MIIPPFSLIVPDSWELLQLENLRNWTICRVVRMKEGIGI